MTDILIIIDDETSVEITKLIGGQQSSEIVQMLLKNPGMTDEELAFQLNADVKEIRKILHRLHDLSLVSYEILRDKDTGHRFFRWRVQSDQIAGFTRAQIQKLIIRLREKLEYEKNHEFYYCGTPGCGRHPFEEAMDYLFRCPVCGKPMNHFDNERIKKSIECKLAQLEKKS